MNSNNDIFKENIAYGNQNIEVSVKLECEHSVKEQILIMEEYTEVHKANLLSSKEERELECLKVLYPKLFRNIENNDQLVGRLDFLPIGFGCVTSLGGVGHYCVFNKLIEMKEGLSEPDKERIDNLYNYWIKHDLKLEYCEKYLTKNIVGKFIDPNAPVMATIRLSGAMLDYELLLSNGIDRLKEIIKNKLTDIPENKFLIYSLKALDIYLTVVDFYTYKLQQMIMIEENNNKKHLTLLLDDLLAVRNDKPKTFHQALQLFWLYALLSGCINYGRLDDLLGIYLKNDLDNEVIDEDEAISYIRSLWRLIENRRTTVNGRIIVGGKGRKNPEAADKFCELAIKVAKMSRYVEPQFTLRISKYTPERIIDLAYDCIGSGATYPVIYNDDVNIPSIMHAMRIDEITAEQYVPYGCGEYVIQGQSIGTSNTMINLLKTLNIFLNGGIDPIDGIKKTGPISLKKTSEIKNFKEFFNEYKKLLSYYIHLSVNAQINSYILMNEKVSFIFPSILMNDCIFRGKSILDGGIRYLGGTNETYGNINAADTLLVIKKLAFEEKKYTLSQMNDIILNNYSGHENIRSDFLELPKYGNDLDEVDNIAVELYEYVSNQIRMLGIKSGLHYYLAVISNNQTNTEWGRKTSASLDGRYNGQYLNPANNPQGGADKYGPTAMLNSLVKLDPSLHGGAVQNIKFTPKLFNENKIKIKWLLRQYFDNGGCQLMINIVDKGILEDAKKHPEKYPDLIVRVSGFSAVFVNLDEDVQDEIISRTLYGV
ncbi:pyruvate formate lyase family protein [Brenneria tiliae]|uniref:pyruvate formate lyase family protein n=1 Tax=Brenneria tiliae TaxID=2914984 RepID=UPI002014B3DF|nr:pyruvate formate lyase family protein [Brenneria tiliae]MCL2895875.1 pyruvate formate-lyase [Brenneria tiliae]MCL2900415.1 pyruvate formate-lyase [Brenneria tiliae]